MVSTMGKWIYVIPFPHEQIFHQPPDAIFQPPDATFDEQIKVLILQPPDATFYHFNITEDDAFWISCTLYYNIRLMDFSNKEVVSD